MVNLLFSYSHKDEALRNELEVHLSPLKRQGIISTWHDRRIELGREWDSEIREPVEKARSFYYLLALILQLHLPGAFLKHQAGEASVIPIKKLLEKYINLRFVAFICLYPLPN